MRKTLLMSVALLGAAMALPAYAQTTGGGTGGAGAGGGNMAATAPQGGQGSQGTAGGNQATNAPTDTGTNQGGTGMAAGTGMNSTGTTQGGTNNAGMNNGGTSGAAMNSGGTSDTGTMGTATGGAMQSQGMQNQATQNEATQNEGTTGNQANTGTGQAATTHRHVTRTHRARMAMNPETGARPGHEPGVGESEPMARHPSNITSSDTRSVIAPRLPAPSVGQNASAETFLHVAHNAIRARRGGEAQEALERAETALLNNPTDPQRAGQVDNGPRLDRIRAALDALAHRDFRTAEQNIAMAEQAGGGAGSSSYGMQGGGQGGYAAMPGGSGAAGNFAGAPGTEGATGPSQYYPSGNATNRGNSFGPGMVNGSRLPNGMNSPANGPGSNSGGGGAH